MNEKKKPILGQEAVTDARTLGTPRMLILGLQHLFAMFGATVLVPILVQGYGLPLSIQTTLLMAGLGTLLFHVCTKFKVPAFLGSSFAYLGGFSTVASMPAYDGLDPELKLAYALGGIVIAGLLYLVLALLFKVLGAKTVMRYFPPIVTGPMIIMIGLNLSGSAIKNAATCWWLALVAMAIIVVANIWGKGMVKIIPILLGVVGSYVVASAAGAVDFTGVAEAAWIGMPFTWNDTVFSIFGANFDTGLAITAIITIMPLAFATMIEHIGDVSAISSTCNRNYIAEPGLHRTLLGDGLATIFASLFGAPANTTYGENTGVLALTKVFDPRVIRIAALFAIAFSFCPKFAAVIAAMPACVIGGVSLVLYGMISAVGIRNLVENHVDFMKSRNVLITALILVLSLGIAYSTAGAIVVPVGEVTISLSGLAVGSIVGIVLNMILPGHEDAFGADDADEVELDGPLPLEGDLEGLRAQNG